MLSEIVMLGEVNRNAIAADNADKRLACLAHQLAAGVHDGRTFMCP